MVYVVCYYDGHCCCSSVIDKVFTIRQQAEGYMNKQRDLNTELFMEYYIVEREIW